MYDVVSVETKNWLISDMIRYYIVWAKLFSEASREENLPVLMPLKWTCRKEIP